MLKRALIALLFSLGIHPAIHAAEQQDQSATGETPLKNAVSWGFGIAPAQTYTAGLSGTLTKISLHIYGPGLARIEIRDVQADSGSPGETILAATTLDTPGLDASSMTDIPIPTPVQQVAGTRYAIVVKGADATAHGGLVGTTDTYDRGSTFVSQDNGTTWRAVGGDRHFRTFVDVPADTTSPTVDVRSPYEAATYRQRDQVLADYSCNDNVAIASCTGTVPTGSPIDTRTPGAKQFTVTAVDSAGNSTVKTINYRIISSERVPPGRGRP